MRKAFRHSGVLMMVAVVALGLLGAAYTLWFEDLQLRAEVSTGTFDADVSLHQWNGTGYDEEATLGTGTYEDSGRPVVIKCTEPIPTNFTRSAKYVYEHLADFGCTFGGFPENKPPTVCDAAIGTFGTAPANSNDTTDDNQLTFLISGAYPYAGCEYDFDFHNDGTVPLHINFDPASLAEYWLCDPDGADAGSEPDNCQLISQQTHAISWISDGNDCDWDGINADGALLDGTSLLQLHAGEEARCRIKILLDQGDNLENKVIISNLRFRAYQWNETVDTTP